MQCIAVGTFHVFMIVALMIKVWCIVTYTLHVFIIATIAAAVVELFQGRVKQPILVQIEEDLLVNII